MSIIQTHMPYLVSGSQLSNSDSSLVSNATTSLDTFPFSSIQQSGIVKNGTLQVDEQVSLPITYEEKNGTQYFEGDIILTNQTGDTRVAVDKFLTNKPWPNGVIPYKIAEDLPNKTRVTDAVDNWMDNSPMRFILVNETNQNEYPNHLLFKWHEEQCSSQIGMAGGEQVINVPDWCPPLGLVHEIGHAIGLWHEQTRCDRDEYVTIMWENIPQKVRHNFQVHCQPSQFLESMNPNSPIGLGEYDYCSIMHYGRNAGSWNGLPTMVPKHEIVGCEDIGQLKELSERDLSAIDFIYPFLEEGDNS